MHRMRRYLRFDRRESRLPAAIAILASAGLYLLLPAQLSLGPSGVVFPIAAVLGVLPLTIADALGRQQAWQRPLALILLGLTALANGASLGLLVHELIARSSEMSGRQLLAGALTVWASNVIVFALWYWELDRGGPGKRAAGQDQAPDFLFPQMSDDRIEPLNWRPQFIDYLYVSLTNATAFSPTDTLPLSAMAKSVMGVQSLVSLVTLGLIVARAVNVLS